MSLINKKSLFDRHTKGTLGTSVGNNMEGPVPSEGNYYAEHDESGFANSPFTGTGDHMVDLLTTSVQSTNTGVTYNPTPLPGTPNADLNGGTDFHSGQEAFSGTTDPYGTYNTTLNQFGGPYKTTGPQDGFY